MVRAFVRRLRTLEQRTSELRKRLVLKDFDGLYYGECGRGLSEEAFETWKKGQEENTQIIVVVFGWKGSENLDKSGDVQSAQVPC